jgi:hypothetical protein
MTRFLLAFLAILLLAASPAQAERPLPDCRAAERNVFSSLPMLLPSGQAGRAGTPYCMTNLRAGSVEVRNGAGGFGAGPETVPVMDNGFRAEAGKVGNYHWLQAGESTRFGVFTASTVQFFANPGPAPTAMLQLAKADLEIVPQPLPREHWRYRAGETWNFLVRFHGRPVPDMGVRLETSGGTQKVYKTDGQGLVRVTFPDDVSSAPARPGGHDHGSSGQNDFVLAVALTDSAGHYYLTGFNHVYAAAADAGRSLPAGLAFLAVGGVIALPLTLRRKEKNHG